MPTYEYECTVCQHKFEELQKFADKPLAKCPVCGGKLRRLISGGSGLIFKGKGFYVTDYKNTNSAAVSGQKKDLQPKPKEGKKDIVPAQPVGEKDKTPPDKTKKPDK